MPLVADVAVPVPLAHPFTYGVPDAMAAALRPGARVACDLGTRRLLGVVVRGGAARAVHVRAGGLWGVARGGEEPALGEGKNLKPLRALVDTAEPVVPE